MYDYLIRGAYIIDGSGTAKRTADVAIQNGKLICDPPSAQSAAVIEAQGLYLCPGFIDAHAHGDMILGTPAGQLCKVSQGVTTEITGECGTTLYPVSTDQQRRAMLIQSAGAFTSNVPEAIDRFTDLGGFLAYARSRSLTNNFKILTGHNALRIAAMGYDKRKPTSDELEHMKSMLRRAMEQGSMGMSSGLFYTPSGFADEEEIVALCRVVAEFDGIYTTHMRNESNEVVASVEASIRAAKVSGCRLNISHHKICGRENWGKSIQTLCLVDRAADEGVRVTLDVYPYTASMTNLNVCLPQWFFANGPEKMQRLLRDPAVRRELIPEIMEMDGRYRQCGGFENIMTAIAPNTPQACGYTIAKYANICGKEPFEAFFDLVAENGHAALAIYFSMSEEDLQRILLGRHTVLSSDSLIKNLEETTHPRAFGSFPRAIRYFVKEKGLLTLEQMIHKMTGMTAERLMVAGKGLIRTGYDADLVLFDYDALRDKADYHHCFQPAEGIEKVFVGGQIVYENQSLTGIFPGRFLPHRRTT